MLRMSNFAITTVLTVTLSCSAYAGSKDMVVVHVKGASFERGAVIDGNRPITLKAGEKVTLVGSDGKSITMLGPKTATPFEVTSKNSSWSRSSTMVVEVIGALLSKERRSTKALGVVRSANPAAQQALPNEWAVNVAQSGTKCIGGNVAMLWRVDSSRQEEVRIKRSGGARTARAIWPEGQEYLAVSRKIFQDGQNYAVSVNDRKVEIKVNVMPVGLSNPAEQAAWMARKNCTSQALAMVDRIR